MKQSTSDPLKKPNFILQILFAYFKGSGQTGKAVVPGGAAVDKLFVRAISSWEREVPHLVHTEPAAGDSVLSESAAAVLAFLGHRSEKYHALQSTSLQI